MAKRGAGEGSIRRRKDGLWEARVTVRGGEGDKRKRVSKYFRTRKEAKDWLNEAIYGQRTGSFAEPNKIVFGDWLARWLEVYVRPRVRESTYANYEHAARTHIIPHFGKVPLQKMTTDTIQEFYNVKAARGRLDGTGGLSARMLHLLHQLINGSMKQAARQRLIAGNPAEWTTRPGLKSKEMAALDAEQLRRYLEAAKGHRLYAAFALEVCTGLRRGELLALTWDCVDLVNGTVQVRRSLSRVRLPVGGSELRFYEPKTESGKRTIPVPPEMVRELREHRRRQAEEKLVLGGIYQDNNLVFSTPTGTPVEPRNFHRLHAAILKKAGLPHVRVHDLRHSFASILADAGENPETLRALLGHARTSTTMDLYCHANDKGKRRAVARLAGLIGQPGR